MMTLLASNLLQVHVFHIRKFIVDYVSRSLLSEPDGVGRLRHGDECDLGQEHRKPGGEARHPGQGLQGRVVSRECVIDHVWCYVINYQNDCDIVFVSLIVILQQANGHKKIKIADEKKMKCI